MSILDKLRKVVASAVMILLVGVGTAVVTAIQRPDADGIVVFSLTYIIFSNGIVLWLVVGLVEKQRLGRLSYSVGDVLLGPVDDVLPTFVSPKTTGTVGAMVLVTGFLSVFVSGVLEAEVLSFLGQSYDLVTVQLTRVYWITLQSLWEGAPVSLQRLLEASYQGAGSLAAAAAVLLGELIGAVGVDDPEDLLR